MKRIAAAVLAQAPVTVWAHAGHGLAPGHEWFHALVPFAGALLVVLLRAVVMRSRAPAKPARPQAPSGQ